MPTLAASARLWDLSKPLRYTLVVTAAALIAALTLTTQSPIVHVIYAPMALVLAIGMVLTVRLGPYQPEEQIASVGTPTSLPAPGKAHAEKPQHAARPRVAKTVPAPSKAASQAQAPKDQPEKKKQPPGKLKRA